MVILISTNLKCPNHFFFFFNTLVLFHRWWTIFYLLTLSNDLSLIASPYEAIKVTGLEMIIMATALSGTPWQGRVQDLQVGPQMVK